MSDLADLVRQTPALAVRLAVEQVQTVEGAMRLWRVEREGRRRIGVLWAIERRIAELRAESSPIRTRITIASDVR